MEKIHFSTNWLASKSVFYNEKTLKVSHNINDVIDYDLFEWDAEGLFLYLKFGYVVMGITPIKYVKFLPPNSSITVENNKLTVVTNQDDVADLLYKTTNEHDVLEQLQLSIKNWEKEQTTPILIPTSGGFDSRLLNMMIEDKSRIYSYTYGASKKQDQSREVVHAKLLSEKLGTKWESIKIGNQHCFFSEWNTLYGPSANCSGLYHYEFYHEIHQKNQQKMAVLSGIIGDAWAGALNISPVDTKNDLVILGHTHKINANPHFLKLQNDATIENEYWQRNKDLLKDPLYRIVETMRFKLLFLSFLFKVPESFGDTAWSPYLDKNIAIGMLNLPKERRFNRIWQRDFFRSQDVLFEEMNLSYSRVNSVNYLSILAVPLNPLNVSALSEILDKNYLEWINKKLNHISFSQHVYQYLMHAPYIKEGLKIIGFKNTLIEAYYAYITIKPLESLILLRNSKNEI